MSDPVFLVDGLDSPAMGDTVTLAGDEGRHAVVVRRIRVGERVVLTDGRGLGVEGTVTAVADASLRLKVDNVRQVPEPAVRYVVGQAVAKGDRAELAVEMLTEVGVDEILPWSASRSIVRWSADRAARGLARWRSTAREATKQSRRLRAPLVGEPVSTTALAKRIAQADLALVLHEEATEPLSAVALPPAGTVLIIVGPEGGIAPMELDTFVVAGAHPVSISDGVLRTSTAGAVAVALLRACGVRP